MTKLQIFNIALGEHGKQITQADITNNIYEAQMCETYYRNAVLNVLGECDWNFLLTRVVYDPDYDYPEGGWTHGFLLPQGILRVVPRSSYPYEVIGNKFLTNEDRPEIYVMMDTFDPEVARDEICYLIGYNLAFLLCQKLSPANNVLMQMILQNYNLVLTPLKNAQATTYFRTIEECGTEPVERLPYVHIERAGNHSHEVI